MNVDAHAAPLRGSLPPGRADLARGGPAPDRSSSSGCKVAIVGAGAMGGAMVARLCEQGWAVVVCDIDPLRCEQALAAGARIVATPAAAAAALVPDGVLILVVVDAQQCREVLLGEQGAAAVMAPGQTVMLCPTISPADTVGLADALARLEIDVIDAPMSGGPARARLGQMSLMLAAPQALVQRHAAVLQVLSSHIFRISERVGDGARTKLVNNLLAGINLVGAAEALALAERLGLDTTTTLGVIEASSGQSWIGSDRMRRAIVGDFDPRARVTLLEKDTRLALEAAQAAGFSGPLGERVAGVFAQARAAGLAELDDAALLTLLRQLPTH